jgi:hypothetical protein
MFNSPWSDCIPRYCIFTGPRAGPFCFGTLKRGRRRHFDGYADQSRQGRIAADT